MDKWKIIEERIKYIISKSDYLISNLSNISAIFYEMLDDINWVGFYLLIDDHLILGPFQGKSACTSIEIGKGVCGTCVLENKTQLVENVHKFPGHIACDSNSKSEIVIPIYKNNKIFGVLDIDSPIYNRFDENDKINLEIIIKLLEKKIPKYK